MPIALSIYLFIYGLNIGVSLTKTKEQKTQYQASSVFYNVRILTEKLILLFGGQNSMDLGV